jgi:hypothetical protein
MGYPFSLGVRDKRQACPGLTLRIELKWLFANLQATLQLVWAYEFNQACLSQPALHSGALLQEHTRLVRSESFH